MNWLVIGITSGITFVVLSICIILLNKNDPVKLLDKNIQELGLWMNYRLFEYDDVFFPSPAGGYFSKQIRFGSTKTRLLNKCNQVNAIICNMINLYYVDNEIKKFYSEQAKKIRTVVTEIEKDLEELSMVSTGGKDYQLSESEKMDFNKLNNRINEQITDFIIGNAKFYTRLKFYKSNDKNITKEQLDKKYRAKKILMYIGSLVVSFAISILANYISSLIGL